MGKVRGFNDCFSIVMGCVVFPFIFSSCAMDQAQTFSTPSEHYGSVMDRQKAGLESEGEVLDSVQENSVEEYVTLGDAHVQQGQLARALVYYQKALAMDPAIVSIRYKVGLMFLKREKPQKAYEQFEEILQYDVMYALAFEGMGQALLQLGDDIAASQQFQRALSFDPQLWTSHNYLGILADRRHLHLSAIVSYKAALAIKPHEPTVLNNLGMAYYMNAEYSKAVQTFHLALHTGEENQKISNNLGLSLAKLGRFPEAFDAFHRGTTVAMAYNNVGITLLEAGSPHQAITCFKKAIEVRATFYEKANQNLMFAHRVANREKRSRLNVKPQKVVCF